jgi:hypothetical protein
MNLNTNIRYSENMNEFIYWKYIMFIAYGYFSIQNSKLINPYLFQEVQIHCIPPTGWLVLGISWEKQVRDIEARILHCQKLSTLLCRGNSPESTDSTAASMVSPRLLHLFAQYEYSIWCKYALCSKYGKISHVTWKIPFLIKHCSLTDVD